ncbi:clusterin-like protein 1 [Scleropages formosus]|uniref:clusterin-like protein 1 n=1 Tax=Scleropages formosus TaxID=113540 RepID=UPI0010FA7B63|nr:clusterin-like protein 1 [Scleropages formosus]
MRALLVFMVLLSTLGILRCSASTVKRGLSEETLRKLSQDGEKYVDEEMKSALFGVKRMKEVMERNEEKHEHLMNSLKHSREKKKGAEQLAKEVEQKLGEAEQQCRGSLQASWEECRPCLEDACKTFYTSTCRRGFSSFSSKVEEFFRKMSSQFQSSDSEDLVYSESAEGTDVDVELVEDSFSRLRNKVLSLYDKGVALVSRMHQEFDQAFQAAFISEPKPKPLSVDWEVRETGFFQGIRLDDVLDSFFDFGRSVIEEFSSVITEAFDDPQEPSDMESGRKTERELFPRWVPSQDRQLCKNLRRQTSECWQLQGQCESCQGALSQECPNVRELYMELTEVSQLLNVSRQQYEEVLQIVQHHTDDTITWLSDMASRFSWVAQLVNNSTDTKGIFSIAAVVPHKEEGDGSPVADTTVELNVLNSPTFTLSVPAELEVQDPAFIQYVAQEALGLYKQMAR